MDFVDITAKRVSFDLERPLHAAATLAAARSGVSLAQLLRGMLLPQLQELPPAPSPVDSDYLDDSRAAPFSRESAPRC